MKARSLFADGRSPSESTAPKVASKFGIDNRVTVYHGDCLELLASIPDESVGLVVTSPPYNIGKSYERKVSLEAYTRFQSNVLRECARILSSTGSVCWQVGNYVDSGEIVPLDILLYPVFANLGFRMRNRIVWRFEHGLHCSRRLSGRYETICWYTKSDDYVFDVDPIRVPQKYPNKKYFKGPKAGMLSCNPAGKNPGDVWEIPNVKNNHVEKTDHPCQFPVELVERLVLSMTRPDDLVVDPFLGAGSSCIAALRHGRRSAGSDTHEPYCQIARERLLLEAAGELRTRPMDRPIHDPGAAGKANGQPTMFG